MGTKRSRKLRRADQGGFVLPLFAATLTVLLGFAGVGVDVWNWYYTAQKSQRAADAAALAGAVFMPEDLDEARLQARLHTTANGFPSTDAAPNGVVVEEGSRPSQLRVQVESTVTNNFLRFFGNDATTITRDAIGEYAGRVPMGSPENVIGNDPDLGRRVDHWVSNSGRNSDKQGGDRYQSRTCPASLPAFHCPSGGANPEYNEDGYTYVVRVNGSSISGSLRIQAFDPAFVPMTAQDCGETGGSREPLPTNTSGTPPSGLANVTDDWADAVPRYDDAGAPGGDRYCVGDTPGSIYDTDGVCRVVSTNCNQAFDPNLNDNLTQTFIVRAPDNTPTSDLDNPIITNATCGVATQQFAPWTVHSNKNYYHLLDNDDGYRDGEAAAFHTEFRQWVTLCTIPQATVNTHLAQGRHDFIVQSLTNAPYGTPSGRTADKAGRNHYSLRAYVGNDPAAPGDVDFFANGRLPLHAAAEGADTQFYVAKVGPGNAGRNLAIEFYDVGDSAVAGNLTILSPQGMGGSAWTCTFRRTQSQTQPFSFNVPPSSGCTLTNVHQGTGYQGSVTIATVGIPSNYTCDPNTAFGCWVRMQFTYPAGQPVSDHTVWSAGLVGDPVRLIE